MRPRKQIWRTRLKRFKYILGNIIQLIKIELHVENTLQEIKVI